MLLISFCLLLTLMIQYAHMDEVSQVREKIDIVSFISEFISLKKAGRNFKANCPFHNEKSASFVVSPERQIWHCFGCQKGGDCFSFLMDYEHMEFPEALRTLAKRAGIELKSTFTQTGHSEKEKIYTLNKLAARFYSYVLTTHPTGKRALEYLTKKREITPMLINTFQIGFSPSSGNALVNYLMAKKNYQKKDLYEAGLSFERSGRVFDFFRGRIIFPLTDHRGNIVGFSGRVLQETNDGPKYINTKDTIVYHKGSLFFGLDSAKDEIKKQEQAILVEGEFDAISLFKEGIKNVVAVKGTALTDSQVALLSRFTPKVTLCLDKDNAGFEAIKRSLSVLEKRNMITTVIIPNGKDPDEAIKSDPGEFKKAVKNNIGVYDFLVDRAVENNKNRDALSKRKISEELLPFFAQIDNEVVKEHYLKMLSGKIDISYESLEKEIEKIKTGRETDSVFFQRKDKRSRRLAMEEYVVSLILQDENLKNNFKNYLEDLGEYKFEFSAYEKILSYIREYLQKDSSIDIKLFAKNLPKELTPAFDTCYLLPLPKFDNKHRYTEEIRKVSMELLNAYVREEIKNITKQIREKEKEENEKETEKLRTEFTRLTSLLKSFQL